MGIALEELWMMEKQAPQSAVIWQDNMPALTLICSHCGQVFEPAAWQPRIRCPHCETLGYPDRSGRNLLSLHWECPQCHAENDGLHNFCRACGAGLASRCLRCEQPVYNVVCHTCGTRQSQVVHYRSIEERRETWAPVVRSRIHQQKVREEWAQERPSVNPSYGVAGWRSISQQAHTSPPPRPQKQPRRISRQRRVLGWLAIITGLVILAAANFPAFVQWLLSDAVAASLDTVQAWWSTTFGPTAENILIWLTNWWQSFAASLNSPLSPQDSAYTYLFATGVIGLALFPILLYLLIRLIRRIFP